MKLARHSYFGGLHVALDFIAGVCDVARLWRWARWLRYVLP